MDISPKLILQDRANIMPSSGVRRALFNCKVNHNEIKTDLRQKMDEIHQESRERWNFDFEEEKPLAGSYDWQEVQMDEEVPSFYQKEYTSKVSCFSPPRPKQKLPKYCAKFDPLYSPKKLILRGVLKRRSSTATVKSLSRKLKCLPINETKAAVLATDSDSESESDSELRGIFKSCNRRINFSNHSETSVKSSSPTEGKKETIPGKIYDLPFTICKIFSYF